MFHRDESGGIAMIFALVLPVMLAGVAGAVEYTRATAYKQRLTSATELACNQGAIYVRKQRKVDLTKDYSADVQTIVRSNIDQKQISGVTTATPTVSVTTVHVENTGVIQFLLGAFLPQPSMSFTVARDCLVIPAAEGDPNQPIDSKLLFSESFEVGHTVQPNAWDVLKNWNGWTTTNAGVEINGLRSLASNNMVNGDFFAELDSDCGTSANRYVSNCQSNSAMTRSMSLDAGSYEIRYWYISRHGYINTSAYGTQPICSDLTKPQGTARDDFAARASKESTVAQAIKDQQTFRIEVYIDKSTDTLFTAANLLDACIWSDTWIERKINFTVAKQGSYRISWRAAGRQDSYGGLIDYLRICQGTCP